MTKFGKPNALALISSVLESNETEFNYADITDRLLNAGIEIASKTPINSVNQALQNNPDFIKLGSGQYRLADNNYNESLNDSESLFESESPTPSKPPLKITTESLLNGTGIPEDVIQRVEKNFKILQNTIDFVASGLCNGAVIGGSAGVGKSHTVFDRLDMASKLNAMQRGGKSSVKEVRNKITPRQLFNMLYEHREVGNVIVLDDCDSIIKDETGINIIKSATELKDKRTISYYTAGSFGGATYDDTPPSFTFEGSLVIISNIDFIAESKKNTKMAPHFKAMLDRSQVINVGCYDEDERFARIHSVIKNSDIFQKMELTEDEQKIVMDAVVENRSQLRDISLRTIETAAKIYNSYHMLGNDYDPEWLDHFLHVRGKH